MFKGKKGDIEREELLKWIIFFFAVAALIVITTSIVIYMRSQSQEEKCRLSVVARHKAKLMGKSLPIKLDCTTRKIEIKEDGIYVYGKREKRFEGDLEANVKRAVAEEMYLGWKEFARGQADPWGDWGIIKTHCIRTSDIHFDEGLQQKVPKLTSFGDYLNNENIPTTDITYSSYLSNGQEKIVNIDLEETSVDYSVVFILTDVGIGGTVAAATGAGCGGAAAATWIINVIPIGGQIGYAGTTVGGCVIGFGTGVWKSFFGNKEEKDIRSAIALIPKKDVAEEGCQQMY